MPESHSETMHRQHRPASLSAGLSPDSSHDSSSIPYQDEREQKDSALQIIWSKNIGEGEITPSSYQKVAVLLLSWDIDCDDLKTKEEACIDLLTRVMRLMIG